MIKNFKAPSGYKIIISLAVLSVFFHPRAFPLVSFNIALADSCDDLRPVLDKFYQASQEENIEAYMAVMDEDYLRENLVDNYEDYVKSAWEVYDTKEYKLDIYNCKMAETDAIAYLNLATTLVSDGQEVETQRNYVALFHKLDTWKIKYVMDEDDFSQFQSSLHTQLFLDATKEELTKTLDDAQIVLENAQREEELLAGDYEDTVAEGVAPRKQISEDGNAGDKGNGFLYFILFIMLAGGGGFAYLKIKNKKE